MVTVLRAVERHKPAILIGDGQGALVALGVSRPVLLETALAARNVQTDDARLLAEPWGALKLVIATSPHQGKAKLEVELIKRAVPELFEDSPWDPVPVVAIIDPKNPKRDKERDLLAGIVVMQHPRLDDVPFQEFLGTPDRLIWEHNGKCACGKKTYLFAQCVQCAKDEANERHQDAQECADTEEDTQPDALPEEGDTVPARTFVSNTYQKSMQVHWVTRSLILAIAGSIAACALDRPMPEEGEWAAVPSMPGLWCAVQDWAKGGVYHFPDPPEGKPYRATWIVKPCGDVALMQQCVDGRWERANQVGPDLWDKDWNGLRHALSRLDAQAELTQLWEQRQRGSEPNVSGAKLLRALLAPMGKLSAAGNGEPIHLEWKNGTWRWITGKEKHADLTLGLTRTKEESRRVVTMASPRWIFDEATLGFDEEDSGSRPPEPRGLVAAGPGRGRSSKDTRIFRDVVELSDDQHSWLKKAEKKRGELALSAQDDADMVPLSWGGASPIGMGVGAESRPRPLPAIREDS